MTTKSEAGAADVGHAVARQRDDHGQNDMLERVIVGGDLSKLTPEERLRYYKTVCESVGLNPFTAPFSYLYLQNRMVLYARKEATEQLRQLHQVSITKLEAALTDGIYTVTAFGHNKQGRTDAATGAVSVEGKRGQEKADLVMKCETKAKRRLTLSLCGLGMLDESEVEVPPTAVTATEVVPASLGDPLLPHGTHEAPVLFPTPEADRQSLVQRARIGMARLNKDKVAEHKRTHFGGEQAELTKVDLAALVSFVRDLEAEQL